MALSSVAIANMSLSLIGAKSRIEALTDNNVEARQCNLWYEPSRHQVLEALDWNFARKRVTLSLHEEEADEIDWAYRYQMPADALVLRKLVNPNGMVDDAVPYAIENSTIDGAETILTNLEDAVAVYTFDQTNPAMYTPHFVQALVVLLAASIANVLTGKMDIQNAMFSRYLYILRVAAAFNSQESVPSTPREAEWIRGR